MNKLESIRKKIEELEAYKAYLLNNYKNENTNSLEKAKVKVKIK